MQINTTTPTIGQNYDTSNQYYNIYYDGKTYEYIPINQVESMNIPLYSYMYTLFLGMGCYSFVNPTFMYSMMVNFAFSIAHMLFNGFTIYNEYIYTPFNKHIYKPLVYILNIQEQYDEIMIIKDGVVIYSFNTMADFIKNNPINFVRDKSDDGDDEASDDNVLDEKKDDSDNKNQTIDTIIDADLTNTSTDIHTSKQNSNDDDVDTDVDATEDLDDSEDDDFILDPSEYDFLIRTLYYEEEYERHCVRFKYETFVKSDMNKVYTNHELKLQISNNKLIGANLHMNSKKYDINLTNPANYFVINNSILGYYFLKWYMAETHNVVLQKNYSIFCIDNRIGMYTLVPGKKLLVYRNTLKVIDDEAYVEAYVEVNEESDADTNSEENKEQKIKSEHLNDICDIEVVGYE